MDVVHQALITAEGCSVEEQEVQQETSALAQALHVHGDGHPLTTELYAAYRQARPNFANVDDLRKALQDTSKGKMATALSLSLASYPCLYRSNTTSLTMLVELICRRGIDRRNRQAPECTR